MATYTSGGANRVVRAGLAGNLNATCRHIVGNGAGADTAIGDVINFIRLPAFCTVFGVKFYSTVATTGLTVSAGYAPTDGSTASAAAFIAAGTDASGTNAVNDTLAKPVYLDKESLITVTLAGAAVDKATEIGIVIEYGYAGTP